jgi:hypothetical protein
LALLLLADRRHVGAERWGSNALFHTSSLFFFEIIAESTTADLIHAV